MKVPNRPLAPHVQAAITGVQAKLSPSPGRPLAAHVQAAIQAKPVPQVSPKASPKAVARPAPKAAKAPASKPALQAKLASHPPALPAGRLLPRPPAPAPAGHGRARAIQRAESSEEDKLKFWVKKGDEYEWHDEELDTRKYYDTGEKYRSHVWKYPVYKKVPELIRAAVTSFNPDTWDPLVAPIPSSIGKNTRAKVEHLFYKFCGTGGIGYDVMGTSGPLAFDKVNADSNSCIGLSNSFLVILMTHGIKASVESIREGSQPPFIVQVSTMMDRSVQGHIYFGGVKLTDYYKFTNHSAVWVPELNLFFDPMGISIYSNLAIDAELEEVSTGVFNSIKGSGPMNIAKRRPFALTETKPMVKEKGNFRRMILTLRE